MCTLQFIVIVADIRYVLLQSLSLSQSEHNLSRLTVSIQCGAFHAFPMVKYSLRESLSTGCLANVTRESERFVDRKINFYSVQRDFGSLFFSEDMSSSTIQDRIDSSHCGIGTEDFNEENGFLESGLRKEFRGVED